MEGSVYSRDTLPLVMVTVTCLETCVAFALSTAVILSKQKIENNRENLVIRTRGAHHLRNRVEIRLVAYDCNIGLWHSFDESVTETTASVSFLRSSVQLDCRNSTLDAEKMAQSWRMHKT